jgi:hypothetical protein
LIDSHLFAHRSGRVAKLPADHRVVFAKARGGDALLDVVGIGERQVEELAERFDQLAASTRRRDSTIVSAICASRSLSIGHATIPVCCAELPGADS